MKIGLITIHDTLNYGSLLQTIGLYKAISDLGIDIQLIDYKCKAIAAREKIFSWNECHSIKDIIRHFLFYNKLSKKKENYWSFLRSQVFLTKPYNRTSIKETNKLFDCFVVGSDIVWGSRITGKDYTFMLDFTDDTKKRIACSSSIGDKWQEEDYCDVSNCLKRFDAISVRESQAVNWVREVANMESVHTCDPTMIMESAYWRQFIAYDKVPKCKYVLIYMGAKDSQHVKDGIKYGKDHNLPVYYMNDYIPVCGVNNIQPDSVGLWLGLIANAEVVFSASYHGVLFSLYFQRDFFYYNNRGSNSRLESLSKEFDIQHREGNLTNLKNNSQINWSSINNIIEKKRNKTKDYLKQVLLSD